MKHPVSSRSAAATPKMGASCPYIELAQIKPDPSRSSGDQGSKLRRLHTSNSRQFPLTYEGYCRLARCCSSQAVTSLLTQDSAV